MHGDARRQPSSCDANLHTWCSDVVVPTGLATEGKFFSWKESPRLSFSKNDPRSFPRIACNPDMDNSPSPVSGAAFALTERSPSEAVVLVVAEAADTDPMELHSLHDVIDPDALDAIFQHRPSGTITFEYSGYIVTVQGNTEIIVQETAPGEPH